MLAEADSPMGEADMSRGRKVRRLIQFSRIYPRRRIPDVDIGPKAKGVISSTWGRQRRSVYIHGYRIP